MKKETEDDYDPDFKEKISSLNILIVDDQAEIRLLIANVLGELGVPTITEANNGQQALQNLNDNKPAVNMIICDWNMPIMNGLEFLKEVRRNQPTLPFLMLTSRRDETSVLGAIDQGVSAYISKPFRPEQLERKLKLLLTKECTRA